MSNIFTKKWDLVSIDGHWCRFLKIFFCCFVFFASKKSQLTNRTMNDTWLLKILRLTKELKTAWLFSKLGNIRTIPGKSLPMTKRWEGGLITIAPVPAFCNQRGRPRVIRSSMGEISRNIIERIGIWNPVYDTILCEVSSEEKPRVMGWRLRPKNIV